VGERAPQTAASKEPTARRISLTFRLVDLGPLSTKTVNPGGAVLVSELTTYLFKRSGNTFEVVATKGNKTKVRTIRYQSLKDRYASHLVQDAEAMTSSKWTQKKGEQRPYLKKYPLGLPRAPQVYPPAVQRQLDKATGEAERARIRAQHKRETRRAERAATAAPTPPKIKPATPAQKTKAKKEAAKLPTPVTVAEITTPAGETIKVSDLNPTGRILTTLAVGDEVKMFAQGFVRGPVKVKAVHHTAGSLDLELVTKKGNAYRGKTYTAMYHWPKREKGRLVQYRPWVLLPRGRSSIQTIERYEPELEEAPAKGIKPGSKAWDKAPDNERMAYFRNALYQLSQQKNPHRAEDQKIALILAVERPLEKAYVCEALKEYGKVGKVRHPKIGDVYSGRFGFYQLVALSKTMGTLRKLEEAQRRLTDTERLSGIWSVTEPMPGEFTAAKPHKLKIRWDWRRRWKDEKAVRSITAGNIELQPIIEPYFRRADYDSWRLWRGHELKRYLD
jgi:hypothetical protein